MLYTFITCCMNLYHWNLWMYKYLIITCHIRLNIVYHISYYALQNIIRILTHASWYIVLQRSCQRWRRRARLLAAQHWLWVLWLLDWEHSQVLSCQLEVGKLACTKLLYSDIPMPLSSCNQSGPFWPKNHFCCHSKWSRTDVKTFKVLRLNFEIQNAAYAMYCDDPSWAWFRCSTSVQSLPARIRTSIGQSIKQRWCSTRIPLQYIIRLALPVWFRRLAWWSWKMHRMEVRRAWCLGISTLLLARREDWWRSSSGSCGGAVFTNCSCSCLSHGNVLRSPNQAGNCWNCRFEAMYRQNLRA